MIAVLDGDEGGAFAERFSKLAHQRDVGERIARPLQEQHGDFDLEEMLGALLRGAARRMQRKSEERQAAHARERSLGLRLRGHAAAERFAAGDQRKLGHEPRRLRHRGTHRGLCKLRRIGALAALLHIGELIAKRGDAALGEPIGDRRAMKGWVMPAPAPWAST